MNACAHSGQIMISDVRKTAEGGGYQPGFTALSAESETHGVPSLTELIFATAYLD
jgi:hypothetical protein